MMLLNAGIGLYEGIKSGAGFGSILGGLAGGLIGGTAFGMLGQGLASGLAAQLGSSAFTFAGGALIGAVEFGVGGFGAGLGGALGSGASFSQALRAGGMGAAFGAVMGAGIEGSYMAGWQNSAHGLSIPGAVGSQARSGLYSDSYFNSLNKTLSARANPYGVYLHYGYGDEASSFGGGMRPGSYGTKDVYVTGAEAQQRLALPIHRPNDAPPDAMYTVTVDLSKTQVAGPLPVPINVPVGPGTVREGGGTEYIFPGGTPPGSVSEPTGIPQY